MTIEQQVLAYQQAMPGYIWEALPNPGFEGVWLRYRRLSDSDGVYCHPLVEGTPADIVAGSVTELLAGYNPN